MTVDTYMTNDIIMASTSNTNSTQRPDKNVSEAVNVPDPSTMLPTKGNQNQIPQIPNITDNEISSSVPASYSTPEISTLSSSLPSGYDSPSLNPRVTFQRALSSLYNRWMKVIISVILR